MAAYEVNIHPRQIESAVRDHITAQAKSHGVPEYAYEQFLREVMAGKHPLFSPPARPANKDV